MLVLLFFMYVFSLFVCLPQREVQLLVVELAVAEGPVAEPVLEGELRGVPRKGV